MAEELGISAFNLLGEGSSFQDTLIDMLSDAPLLARLDGHEIRQLAEYVHAYEVDAGTHIFPEGVQGNCMGLLVSGRIEVLKQDREGSLQRIAVITAGKTFGEMSLVDGLPYSATIGAMEKCIILLLTRHNFQECVQRHPTLGVKLLTEIARLISLRLRQTSGLLVDALSSHPEV